MTALARSLPEGDDVEVERRRAAFARVRAPARGSGPPPVPVEVGTHGTHDADEPRFAVMGLVWAAVLLAVVGWALVTFAARLTDFAANAAGVARSN